MAKRSLLSAILLATGLVFGGHLYAQNAQNAAKAEPVKTEQDSYAPKLWDLNLVSPANPITEIDRSKGYDFYKAIQRAPDESPTKDYVVPGKDGLERILGYLEGPEGKKLFKDDSSLQFEINVYKNSLDSIKGEDETSQSYQESLKNFSEDVKFGDGKITPVQLEKIDEGHYSIVEEGAKGENGRYSYVVPVYVGPKSEITTTPATKTKSAGNVPQHEKEKTSPKKIRREGRKAEKQTGIPASFIFGMNYSGYENSIGPSVGVRFGHSDDLVNIALLGNYLIGLSGKSSVNTSPVSPAGLYGKGTINDSGFQSIGLDALFYYGNEKLKWVLDLGGYLGSYVENQQAQILNSGGQVLSSNGSSQTKYYGILRTGMGVDFKVGKSRLEFDIGADTVKGEVYPFISTKFTIAPPSKYQGR